MKRITILFLAVTLCLFVVKPAFAGGMKIAYVDLQRALMEVSEGKAAKAQLKVYFDEKQKHLDGESERLKKMKEDLDRQGMTIDPQVKTQREGELQQELMKLQQIYMTLQQELKQKENTAVAPILEKMQAIIQEIADKDGYDLVLDKNNSGIVYAPMKFDLTTEMVRIYDKRYPAKKDEKKAK